jgi:hypothetical protein
MKFCLRCDKPYPDEDTHISCVCGLEVHVREDSYIPMTRYKNRYAIAWTYVPTGTLLIIKEIPL